MPRNDSTIDLAVVGYGYWGPNLVRNFDHTPGARLRAVCDLLPEHRRQFQSRYPSVTVTADYGEVLADSDIHAVAIATPVSTHFDLARRALQAGKHVFVEKPLAPSVAECERLIEEANKRNRVLMVDHTFVYTGAVRKIKELVDSGRVGRVFYYDSVRVNLGLFQHDVNVLWDLAVHDLAVVDHLLGVQPGSVSATGIAHVPGQPENIAYLTCFFDNDLIAHFHVNWLAPVKVRRTLIGGDAQMIVYDDLEPDAKVKVYNKGITLHNQADRIHQLVDYRTGDMWAPKLDTTEALSLVCGEFVDSIESARPPLTGGVSGLNVVRILEAAEQSIRQRGKEIAL